MKKLLLTALCFCTASVAQATTINFEGYADPTDYVSFTDSGATFTGMGATSLFEISAYGLPSWGTSGPKILCPYTSTVYCGGDYQVSFASPVKNLQFYFTGDNSTTPLSVKAFLNGLLLGTVSIAGDGIPTTAQLVNLSSFGTIDSIQVSGASADQGGFGYDDFSFTYLPEPSSWAMMLLGFGAIGIAVRRTRRTPKALSA